MMKVNSRRNSNIILLSLIALYILIYRFFVYRYCLGSAESITTAFTMVLFSLSVCLLGFRKVIKNKFSDRILKMVLIFIGAYFVITYGIGLFTGFLANSYSLKLTSIISNCFNVVITIVSLELFRYVFISSNKDKKGFIVLMTILLALLDINMFIKDSLFIGFESVFKFITMICLPIIFKNFMYSYFTYHTDYKASLIYRLIMELYVFIVPIEPDLGDLLTSIVNICFPFILFMSFSRIVQNYYAKDERRFYISKSMFKITDIPFAALLVVLLLMVLGIGPYKMVGIKTGSMTPAINVGDAVIIDKNCNKEELKKGDIIAFMNKDNILVVHRIIKINSDGTFITKGDFNNSADSGYVSLDKVEGKVKFNIPFIAYPAKWLSR